MSSPPRHQDASSSVSLIDSASSAVRNSVPDSPETKAPPASASENPAGDDIPSSEPTSVQVAAEPSIGEVIFVDGEDAPSASTPSRTMEETTATTVVETTATTVESKARNASDDEDDVNSSDEGEGDEDEDEDNEDEEDDEGDASDDDDSYDDEDYDDADEDCLSDENESSEHDNSEDSDYNPDDAGKSQLSAPASKPTSVKPLQESLHVYRTRVSIRGRLVPC
ncbi:hypothetical protein V7S43_007262 [Phytophthora oleae]|uniref:Uncharacterized protein n=1 Tax=Phytophthora oleae TaxID=2107226 RepID=A0ABD3FN03_9STRA